MSDPNGDQKRRVGEQRAQPDEPMDDEEKILDGRDDVNMPALLTKDVQGG
jgi:hypothetical protein